MWVSSLNKNTSVSQVFAKLVQYVSFYWVYACVFLPVSLTTFFIVPLLFQLLFSLLFYYSYFPVLVSLFFLCLHIWIFFNHHLVLVSFLLIINRFFGGKMGIYRWIEYAAEHVSRVEWGQSEEWDFIRYHSGSAPPRMPYFSRPHVI